MQINENEKSDLNSTPSANRVHISFFGRTNAGKSSLINAITGQEISLVSEINGTTTDPVKKAMEILPLGPVVLIDTPGIDDESILGEKRVEKTRQVIESTDIAVVVVDINEGLTSYEEKLLKILNEKKIKSLIVYNKADLIKKEHLEEVINKIEKTFYDIKKYIVVSAKNVENINELRKRLGEMIPQDLEDDYIISDKLNEKDIVILVIPIDSSAPKGRLILPQQQTIRDILDINAQVIAVQETELFDMLNALNKKPKVVITDSQVFEKVKKIVPEDIFLTSFSILFARKKGDLLYAIEGAKKLDELVSGSKILISEACTHHRQCEDIGTVKLPKWIEKYTGKKFVFEFTSGGRFPENLDDYSLIIHCGGCMINRREMQNRIERAKNSGIAMTNYGIIIAYMQGILERSIEIFK